MLGLSNYSVMSSDDNPVATNIPKETTIIMIPRQQCSNSIISNLFIAIHDSV
ncbi:hypothetical protein BDB00DRAFT_823467 [Zychaea mexicana]|uniref:uncharacterized protein n=1 Tax=Zychaea mexicana TaxID=64656 RepID=UPI0022FDB670|nr:uncharacterized protein BDB00DRAFT_823467 [Zychaea mexicana]KAI9493312.1 hypothetical protein BDB00DRAFT_823467 [Zychaea mexicana]